ncbi:MAG: hypothetical protein HDS43_04895 [Bacteroides sp.]|nr:hypothetical protein [Bacteroides sp.]
MKIRSILTLLTTVIIGSLALLSCSHNAEDIPAGGQVKLRLNLFVNTEETKALRGVPSENATRADWYYEGPANQWEGVESLRVIIVRDNENKTIEHNTLLTFPETEQIQQKLGEWTFPVEGGEKKFIYLVANENSLSEDTQEILSTLYPGRNFTTNLQNILVKTAGETPFIDNNGTRKTYVPMTEYFEITVKERDPELEVTEDSASLFITRAVSKFSFTAKGTQNDKKGIRIKTITVSNLATEAYLFPKETTYTPGKYSVSDEPMGGRVITGFETPESAAMWNYTFTPEAFGVAGNTMPDNLTSSYTPLTYLLESGAENFTVYVTTVTDNDVEFTYGPVKLPNLPRMARNTHVVVAFTFNGANMACDVRVVPYTGITLNVEYGFDFIVKPPKPREPSTN